MKIKTLLKQLACCAMACGLLLTPFSALAQGGDTAQAATLSLDMPKTVEAGKQFAAALNIADNPGWSALTMVVTYDTALLKLVDLEQGEAAKAQGLLFVDNPMDSGEIIMAAIYSDPAVDTVEDSRNMTANGTLVTMYFEVLSTAQTDAQVTIKGEVTEMMGIQNQARPLPETVSVSADIGTLSAEDNRTLPSRTRASETAGTGETSGSSAGDATATQGGNGQNSATTPAASGVEPEDPQGGGTDAASDGTGGAQSGAAGVTGGSGTGDTDSDGEEPNGLGMWWLVIVLAVAAVILGGAALTVRQRARKDNDGTPKDNGALPPDDAPTAENEPQNGDDQPQDDGPQNGNE